MEVLPAMADMGFAGVNPTVRIRKWHFMDCRSWMRVVIWSCEYGGVYG